MLLMFTSFSKILAWFRFFFVNVCAIFMKFWSLSCIWEDVAPASLNAMLYLRALHLCKYKHTSKNTTDRCYRMLWRLWCWMVVWLSDWIDYSLIELQRWSYYDSFYGVTCGVTTNWITSRFIFNELESKLCNEKLSSKKTKCIKFSVRCTMLNSWSFTHI